MFGIEDPSIYIAYLLIFACLIFSIIYGIVNWNKGMNEDDSVIQENMSYEEKDAKVNSEN